MSQKIFIAGASARCAVHSAIQAGYDPLAADLFVDSDLKQLCPSYLIQDYPNQLVDIARQLPPTPWMYTGGLENYPDLVDSISQRHRLLGNPGHVLEQTANPFLVQQVLENQGLHYPEIHTSNPSPGSREWLLKPFYSAGGHDIRWAQLHNLSYEAKPYRDSFYYQRFLSGPTYSATYLGAEGHSYLLAVTRQIVGKRFTGSRRFSYGGSVGPITLSSSQQDTLTHIGETLRVSMGLRGLFGVDFIWHQGEIWTIEINPRFPASVEILESSLEVSAVDLHYRVCLGQDIPRLPKPSPSPQHGKAIVYANAPFLVSEHHHRQWMTIPLQPCPTNESLVYLADIPTTGSFVPAGSPILTILVRDKDRRQVLRQLVKHAKNIRQACLPQAKPDGCSPHDNR